MFFFGILFLVIGVIYLVGYLKERSNGDIRYMEGDSSEMGSTVEAMAVIRRIYESPAVLAMLDVWKNASTKA